LSIIKIAINEKNKNCDYSNMLVKHCTVVITVETRALRERKLRQGRCTVALW